MSSLSQGPSSTAVRCRLPDSAVAGFSRTLSSGVQGTVPDPQSSQANYLCCQGRCSPCGPWCPICPLLSWNAYLFLARAKVPTCFEQEPKCLLVLSKSQNIYLFWARANQALVLIAFFYPVHGTSIPDFAVSGPLGKSPVLYVYKSARWLLRRLLSGRG